MKSRSLFFIGVLLFVLVAVGLVILGSNQVQQNVFENIVSSFGDGSIRNTQVLTYPTNEAYYAMEEADVAESEGIVVSGLEGANDSAAANRQQAQDPGVVAIAPAPQPTQTAPQPPQEPQDMFFNDPGTNPFLDTEDDNLSTFAMDVDTASYTLARNYLLRQNLAVPPEAVRVEEFINYFDAGYESPGANDAFLIQLDTAPAPFGFNGHYLMRVGIQGRYIAPEDRAPVFLIFVIDVSGSMDMENRLELVKKSLALLMDELREDDRVGIVVYSDNSRAVLQPTSAGNKQTIMDAINRLRPEGSTNVQAGLDIGYDMAVENMQEGQNTRVIVLSDGVANSGIVEGSDMLETIKDRAEKGITLSTIGFGMGNYNDVLMEKLADDGDGSYYYVDEIREARRVFVHNLTSTLQTIAYDAKIQVEFNPAVTDRYRLLGYENRAIADEDFRNDTVDAGEVGAGQSVTALYELALENTDGAQPISDDVVATVYVRYQDAESREIKEISRAIRVSDLRESFEDVPASFQVQAAAAEFAELIGESYWAQDGSYGDVLRLLQTAESRLEDGDQIAELVDMVRTSIRLADQ